MMGNMAVARRTSATPEFVDLCKTLYGDLIDAQVIWDDVTKAGPDQADTHVNTGTLDKKRLGLRAAAITGGVVGGALGVREGVQGVQEARSAMGMGRALSRGTQRKLAVSGTLGVTDSLDLGVLATEKNKRNPAKGQLQPVTKSVASEVMGGARKMK
jgi:hypothetical protein